IFATDDLKKRDTRSNHTVKSSLSLYLQDCNDNCPKFTKEKYVCSVKENRTGKFNCSVEAKDVDYTHTDIEYNILSGNENYVNITQNTGELSVVQSIDYEEKNTLILNISASDGQFSSSCMVEIHVIDVNDERPQFHGTPYSFSIYENVNGSFAVVGRVNVTDADSNYDINFQNCTGMFNIIEKRDVILMKPLDYENQTIITCSLSANDTDDTKDEVTTNIVIHVLDKNDNAPIFANNCCNVHAIDETTGPNKSVIKLKATDADKSGQNNQVLYAIFSGNSNLLFKIDRSSGEIKTNKNLTGYGGIIIHLVVKATDNGFPALSGYTNVSINVTKLNVNPPAFIGEPYKTKIYEGNDTRTIFEVHAKDKDNDKLEFKVLNFTDYFHFKNNTLYASNIDAENMNKTINVGVQVSDGKWSDISTIIITVIDVNDNFPRVDVDSSCNKTVDDIADIGDVICSVIAKDEDVDNIGFTYTLNDGKGDFQINFTTGVITLKNRFGHNGQNYNMNIVVSDSGSPPKYTNTSLSIHVRDTNPTFQFDSKQIEFNVTENVCDTIAPVNVKPVLGMYNITYEINSENKYLINKTFFLNESSGLLTIAKKSNCIDYEEQNEYKFSIFAKDDGVFPKSAHAEVTINVLDVNEPPNIILTNKTVFLNENSTKGTYVSRVFVQDPDTNEQFRNFKYSLSGSKNFKIDKNGTITIAATNIPAAVYELNVTVTDGGDLSDSHMMHVNVPAINVTYVEKKIQENNTRSLDICNFSISLNGENVSYKIIAAPYSGNFRIKSGSLILDTASAFDREEIEFVSFYVIGYYTKYGTTVANVSVKLHIEDINDCPPYFVDNYYNITINDVTESGTVIGKLDAIDRDIEKENRQLTYDIYTYTDIFAIDNKGNLILKNSTNLDLEIPYVLNVSVSDGIYLSHASVSVVVTDTNNYSPKFNNYTYEFTVTETNMTNIVIGSLSAEDKDKGRNGDITFSILTVNAGDIFTLSNQTNNTCIVESVKPIDREAKEQFSLVIQATDHGIFPRQSTCIVRIKVLDENDNFPIFRGVSSLNGSITENSVNGTRIKFPQINVYDVDFGINGTDGLVYTFNDTKAPFCIGTNKTTYPFVYLCGDIDREGQEVYYLELIARDAYGAYGSHTSAIPLVVRILDVNDVFPKFTEDCYTFNVTENQIQYTTVGNVSITDDDSGKFFLYRIVSGDDGKFVIDSMNGNIYAVGSIDREAQANYTLNISVWDGVNKAYTTVQIYIDDINDNAPQFGHFWNDSLKESLTVEVLENTHKGVILNLTAFDRDATKNGVVKYTLEIFSQGGEPDVFNISTEGGLTLLRPLDREKGDSYKMNVTASDEGVPKLSTSIIVHVKVLDENDNPPVFCNSSTCNITKSTCRTVEKAPVSSVLKVLLAHDPDEGENANVSFTLEQSSVSSLFKIETIGNSISLVSINQPLVTNNLIHEGVSLSADDVQVNVTIIATDGGGLNSSLILLIFVEPINDDMPVFARSVYNFNISENMPKGVTVGQCEATTNDTIKKMTYELISGYTNKPKPFKIETSSGRITTIADLDREMIDNYVFAVQVRDGRTPERTAFAAVKVTIDDINDNAPVFLDDNITLHITENKTVNIKRNVSANDLDKGENAHILYSLNNSYSMFLFLNLINTMKLFNIKHKKGLFHINNSGLLIINGTFDYETKTSYTLFITASDKGLPALNTTSQVNIYVRDVNDNFPVFNKARKFYNVSENNKPFEIFSVNATDKDSGLNGEVIYKLQNIDDVPFGIDPFSGSVYLQSQLDYESKSMYSLSIVAQDLGSPSNNAVENVTIYVVDVYDDIIKFKKDLYEINITTSASRNDSLLNLTVSVPNSIFSLKGVDSEYFNIGEKSGEIVLKKSISSKRQMYVFQAVADDGHGRNASCTVIAHVIGHDVNFDTSEIKLSLMENLNKSTVLVDLNTTAEFSSDGATYTISNVLPTGMDLFFVEPKTGVLKCIKPLDREKYAQYTIIIFAHTSALRRKREISRATSSIKIIVNVDDVNDNSPHFTNDQERVFGVPDNVRANYIVGVIKAQDNDTSDVGKLRYNVTGGRSYVFGVSRVTGEIITLVAIASTTGKSFYLSISVTDGDASHKEVNN
ncbi:cadherin-23-like, partial [Ruditapes philippinarum]|uniref:cadherin-23-like n=1 Tax=Ruditapes philippinarum TaxID=129788 RepID=UPI00295B8827